MEMRPLLFLLLSIVLLWVGIVMGTRIREMRDQVIERESKIVTVLEGALLTLFGLLIGFTFSMAVSRYDTRKVLVVTEANAIGTTWLRTALLAEPARSEEQNLLRQYVQQRVRYLSVGNDRAAIGDSLQRASALQARMWAVASNYAPEHKDVTTSLFLSTLNDTIDVSEERTAANENRIPAEAWWMLLFVGFAATLLVGLDVESEGMGAAGDASYRSGWSAGADDGYGQSAIWADPDYSAKYGAGCAENCEQFAAAGAVRSGEGRILVGSFREDRLKPKRSLLLVSLFFVCCAAALAQDGVMLPQVALDGGVGDGTGSVMLARTLGDSLLLDDQPTVQEKPFPWKIAVYPALAWAPFFGTHVDIPPMPSHPIEASGSTTSAFNGAYFGGARVEREKTWSGDFLFMWAALSASRKSSLTDVDFRFLLFWRRDGRLRGAPGFVRGGRIQTTGVRRERHS